MKKRIPALKCSNKTAAIGGPTMRATLNPTEFKPIALRSVSGVVISDTKASRAGWSNAFAIPNNMASIRIRSYVVQNKKTAYSEWSKPKNAKTK